MSSLNLTPLNGKAPWIEPNWKPCGHVPVDPQRLTCAHILLWGGRGSWVITGSCGGEARRGNPTAPTWHSSLEGPRAHSCPERGCAHRWGSNAPDAWHRWTFRLHPWSLAACSSRGWLRSAFESSWIPLVNISQGSHMKRLLQFTLAGGPPRVK